MSKRIEDKKSQLSVQTQALQSYRAELLELIRTTPAFFHQLLAHVETQKVETFLEKDEKYRCSKESIERLKEDLFEDELRERETQLIQINLPEKMRRACVQDKCSACLFRHDWIDVLMLGCGHLLHEQCFQKLNKDECPTCKKKFGRRSNSYGGIFGAHRQDTYDF